ncbi:MAG: 2-hydroxyacyl-CoA dehydratase family protein [Actinomycetota bacterium]|nr:2-hydroxyacyl-CoA dehydratase family protein [Actinomycetota bacterium]
MDNLLPYADGIRNPLLDQWMDEGGKVVGYSCVATPREILDAAGILPYRIRALGNQDKELADAYLARFNCSFCRACLQLGLDGTYDFLDGLVETNGCDHLRGMFENWQYVKNFDFFHYLKVPHIVTEESLEFLAEEMELYREAISEYFEKDISDDSLAESMQRNNRVRAKMKELFSLRERRSPGITGAEALAVILLESSLPPSSFEDYLDDLIDERREKKITGFRSRLLLAGSATDDLGLLREIEDLGGLVVADALCYGTRAFWNLPELEGDPIHALADAYLKNMLCPRMFDDYPSRLKFVMDAAGRADIDGAVLVYNKFCDLHGVENVRLRMDLEKEGIPVLVLEKEYGAGADIGRIRTRVQAFLERIGG